MKKIGITLAMLLTLSLAFVSCSFLDPMEVLEASDVTSSWANAKWSGTITTKVSGNTTLADLYGQEAGTVDIENWPTSVTYLKGLITNKIEVDNMLFSVEGESVVKANKKRTKLYIEQEITVSTPVGDSSASITIIYEMEKE